MRKMLIVDDVEINRAILAEIFRNEYEIFEAENGQVAIEMLEQHPEGFSMILLDLVMPIKTGIDVLEYMNQVGSIETTPVMMITGAATDKTDIKSYELGAADIVYKPFSRRVITRRVQNLVELYESRMDIEDQLEIRSRELEEAQAKLEERNNFLVDALSSVVEFRSAESGEHITRVRRLTEVMLKHWKELHPECGFSDENIALMTAAAALHDIGKVAIPDEILTKPAKLTAEEFEIMKTHTTLGCEILERFKQEDNEFYRYCYDICRYHHERFDGNGYPDQLKGDEIPIWSQIVSLVDVYDALVSKRVYKEAYSEKQALDMIHKGECGVFNPEIIKCMDAVRFDLLVTSDSLAKKIC